MFSSALERNRHGRAGFLLLSLALVYLAGTGSVKAASVHSSHRYYQDANGTPVFLIGYYNWAAVPDGYYIDHSSRYAEMIQAGAPYKINYIRISLGVNRFTSTTNPPLWSGGLGPTPVPFAYVGSPAKADLNTWDTTFWNGLRDQCTLAQQNGVIVMVSFFDGVELRCCSEAYRYGNSFWKPSNQTASFYSNPDCNNNGYIDDGSSGSCEFYQTTNFNNDVGLGHYEKLVIANAISELSSYNNVLFEIGNEMISSDLGWNTAVTNYVKSLTSKPLAQVGGTAVSNIDGWSDHVGDTAASVKSLVATIVGHGYPAWLDPDGSGLSDADVSTDALRQAAWYSFVGGAANWGGFTRDWWYDNNTYGRGFTCATVGYYKYLETFIQDSGFQFWNALPAHNLISNGGTTNSCLARSGIEYVAYVLSDASVNLDLTAVAGTVNYRFYDPKTGGWSAQQSVAGGAVRTFNKPAGASDWVILIGNGGGPTSSGSLPSCPPPQQSMPNGGFEGYFKTVASGLLGNTTSGSSSTTVSGFQGVAPEGWVPFAHHSSTNPANLTFADETGTVDSGAHSLKITVNSSVTGDQEGGIMFRFNTVSGQQYTVTARGRTAGGNGPYMGVNPNGGTNPADEPSFGGLSSCGGCGGAWGTMSRTFTAGGSIATVAIDYWNPTGTNSVYLDSVTITPAPATDITPPTFGSISPSSTASVTPTITVPTQDAGVGLAVDSLAFRWSTNSGTTWSNWITNVALHYKATVGSGHYLYSDFYHADGSQHASYTIASGDVFMYDIDTKNSSGPSGSIDIEMSGGPLRDSGITDQNSLSGHPATDIHTQALNTWYHREFNIGASRAGNTISCITAAMDQATASPSEFYVRNIMIMNGSTLKLLAWAPTYNQETHTCGPGNSGSTLLFLGIDPNPLDGATPVSCTGFYGQNTSQTTSATTGTLQNNSSTNRIQFSAFDVVSNLMVSSAYTITVGSACTPAGDRTVTAQTGTLCSGTGTNIQVASSENTVSYQLKTEAGAAVGSPVIGNGSTINLPTGNLTTTTQFKVEATATGCTVVTMSNHPTVTVVTTPGDKTVIAQAGSVCSGSGTNIQVAASENGVSYQLQTEAGSNVGSPVTGIGSTINLPTGNLTFTTQFKIVASNSPCSSVTMSVHPIVTVSSCQTVTLQDTTADGSSSLVRDSFLRQTVAADGEGDNNYGIASIDVRLYPDAGFPSGKGPRHNLIWFDLSGIPAGSTITSATFGQYVYNGGSAPTVTGYRLSRLRSGNDWIEGVHGDVGNCGNGQGVSASANEPTWNQRKFGSNNWSTAGATNTATDIDDTTSKTWDKISGSADGYQIFDVTTWVDAWVNNSGTWPNNGMLMWGGSGPGGSNTYWKIVTCEECTICGSPYSSCRPYLTVNYLPPPVCATPTFSGVTAVCADSTGNTATITNPVSGATYNWSISGGAITAGAAAQTVTYTAGAGSSLTLSATQTGSGCSQSATGNKIVTIIANPACSITGPDPVNSGSNNSYNGPASMDSYAWSISAGNGTINGAANLSSVSVDAGASGSYTLDLTVTKNGCSSQCSKVVTIVQLNRGITQWRSVRNHTSLGELPIVLNASASGNGTSGPAVETRNGGIQKIEVDFDGAVTLANPADVTVTGYTTVAGVMGGATPFVPASVSMVDGDTLQILFNPGDLPDESCYIITIGAATISQTLTGDTDCAIRSLIGDAGGNGAVTLADMLLIKSKVSPPIDVTTGPQYDVNLSGTMTIADMLLAKGRVISPSKSALCP